MKKAIIIASGVFILAVAGLFLLQNYAPQQSFLQVENPLRVLAQKSDAEYLPPMKNPHIVIKKKTRKLELFDGEKLIKTYPIALGFAPVGDKEREGDGKTPEGEFYVHFKNEKSKFYLSIGISYPNIEAAKRGLATKLITKAEHDAIVEAINNKKTPPQKTALGGEIFIHGGGSATDWTQGCAALSNADIKELFELIPAGTKVEIKP
ncbi:MAG TPA: L,D-transpeptidase [Pyrinomonadaceae bacterium]|jgi:murein L,D-transpeptidase YafK